MKTQLHTQSESAMEAVKAREPDARCFEFTPGCWLVAYGDDPENPGYANLGPESSSEAEAWVSMRALIEATEEIANG